MFIDYQFILSKLLKLLKSKYTYLAVLVALVVYLLAALKTTREKYEKASVNQETLLDSIKFYKTSDSLNAVQVGVLTLNSKEFTKFKEDLKKELKSTNADKVNSASTVATKTTIHTKEVVRDSIIYLHDTIQIPSKVFTYNTQWTSVKGIIYKDTVDLSIQNRESLALYRSYQRKKFLWFKLPKSIFGYKKETIDVVSRNPNTKIESIQVIDIK